jgi:hypothetical protein
MSVAPLLAAALSLYRLSKARSIPSTASFTVVGENERVQSSRMLCPTVKEASLTAKMSGNGKGLALVEWSVQKNPEIWFDPMC